MNFINHIPLIDNHSNKVDDSYLVEDNNDY